MSKDPIGLADGLNLYKFVGNNPIEFIDSNGNSIILLSWRLYNLFSAIKGYYAVYKKMKNANVKLSDKYFHCVAHCKLSARLGVLIAQAFGITREITDHIRNETGIAWNKPHLPFREHLLDSLQDMLANLTGSACSKIPITSCEMCCCEFYFVEGLEDECCNKNK